MVSRLVLSQLLFSRLVLSRFVVPGTMLGQINIWLLWRDGGTMFGIFNWYPLRKNVLECTEFELSGTGIYWNF